MTKSHGPARNGLPTKVVMRSFDSQVLKVTQKQKPSAIQPVLKRGSSNIRGTK